MQTKPSPRAERGKPMDRATALTGFIIMSLLAFIVCIASAPAPMAPPAVTAQPGSEPPGLPAEAYLIENGGTEYAIIYGALDGEWAAGAARRLSEEILALTGVAFPVFSDEEAENAGEHEILIGHTNRGGDYLDGLFAVGNNGYAVFVSGSRVIVNVYSAAGARGAVNCILGDYVEPSFTDGWLVLNPSMSYVYIAYNGQEPDADLLTTRHKLEFNEHGKFKIFIVSDAVSGAVVNSYTVAALDAIIEAEKPDLVLFCGSVAADISGKGDLTVMLRQLTRPMESRGIPWAHVLGETDAACGLDLESQMEVYSTFDYCVTKMGGGGISGLTNFFLPIYANGSQWPLFGVWGLGYDGRISATGGSAARDPLLADLITAGLDFGYAKSAQIAWYSNSSSALEKYLGRKLPGIMFLNVPLPEFNIIPQDPRGSGMRGTNGEGVRSSPINSGLFSSLLARGDIVGLYAGNNHLNDYSGRLFGIELGFTASIGYDGYGFGGTFDVNNRLRGGRIIELNDEDPADIKSRMVYAANYGVSRNPE